MPFCDTLRNLIDERGLTPVSYTHLLILHIENAGSFPKPLSAKEEKKALEQMASGDTEAICSRAFFSSFADSGFGNDPAFSICRIK